MRQHIQRGTFRVVTAPVLEPVTLTEAKAQCRVDILDDDTFITGLISGAREYVEKIDWRAFLSQTIELWLEGWPCDDDIHLPRPPLQSVTSVKYYDVADVEYTLSPTVYFVDVVSEPGRICLKDNQSWPSLTLREYNAVCVTYIAGWTAAASVPKTIKQAVQLVIGHWYENREASTVGAVSREIDMGVRALINLDRVKRF
jgi:uncharacterized phiE125 gp8 family phage protein